MGPTVIEPVGTRSRSLASINKSSMYESTIMIPLIIALGAIPGVLSSHYLNLVCTQWFGTDFPCGTFIINLSDSLLTGLLRYGFKQLAIECT